MNQRRKELHEYLQSFEWREFRDAAIVRAGKRCQLCGWSPKYGSSGFNVHHNTYKNLGHEAPEDLCVLCRTCHKFFHRFKQQREQMAKVEKKKDQDFRKHSGMLTTSEARKRGIRANAMARELRQLENAGMSGLTA